MTGCSQNITIVRPSSVADQVGNSSRNPLRLRPAACMISVREGNLRLCHNCIVQPPPSGSAPSLIEKLYPKPALVAARLHDPCRSRAVLLGLECLSAIEQ